MTKPIQTYDLKSLKLPYLSGLPLRLFTRIMEGPLKKLLLPNLFKTSGISGFRQLEIEETPTFMPFSVPEKRDPQYIAEMPAQWPERPAGESGFRFHSVNEYARLYRDGAITPLEVAEKVLAAIRESDASEKPLRAFIAVKEEDVLRQAEEAARRIKNGQPRSLFDGVPVAVKDELDMVPYPTTVGTTFMGKNPARVDASIVARMRSAGALLIGKANMHEIGLGVTGFNTHYGPARNPYNPGHYTGGSSSGPAAAVAAGFCPVALGADGGGSIRIPSAFCGLVGIKSTFGRMSEFGAAPLCWSVAHVGPIAASVWDAALAWSVIAGPDPKDPLSHYQPTPDLSGWDNRDLSGLRLGIYTPWFSHASAEMVSACKEMVKNFQSLGAKVEEIEIPDLEAARVAHSITIITEMLQAQKKYLQQHSRDYGYDVRLNLALGRHFTSRDYVQAQQVRTRLIRHFNSAFEKVDAILTPTTGIAAPPIPEKALPHGDSDLTTLIEIMRFATQANLTGSPAISFPVGYNSEGLPLGMQAISRAWDEKTLFRLAVAAEEFVEVTKPQLFYELLGNVATG